ncbi:MAG: DUF4143 domain-containing protein, partial [Acidaminococcaceae bacterium]|nr:DUF4143 domain-containing protein [Acidaminococcaceae bacterium]
PDAGTLANGAMDGAFFETYVVTEIIKSYYNAGKTADFYYYRDTDKKEIDFLILRGNQAYPIEIKKSKNPTRPNRHFGVLDKLGLETQPGIVICMSDELVPYDRTTWLLPVYAL